MKKSIRVSFIIFILFLSVGCSNELPKPKLEKAILNIGYISEQNFEQRYAQALAIVYPDFKYNIIPMKDMVMKKVSVQQWFETHQDQLDLLYIPDGYFQEFIDLGLIKAIDSFIKADKFSMEPFVPATISLTKLYGSGKLYGLAPSFDGKVMAYNKAIFNKNGVDFPQDGMSWEELLSMANRFPQGLSIFGTPLDIVLNMGETQGLRLENENFKMSSPAWMEAWKLVVASHKSGGIIVDDINKNPFLAGERAMSIITYEEFLRLGRNKADFEWATVTMPGPATPPNTTQSLYLNGLLAIPVKSSQQDEAWEMIKFLMSEPVAKWNYRSDYGISSLKNVVTLDSAEEVNLEAFYRLEPIIPQYTTYPEGFLEEATKRMDQTLDGSLSLEEALLK